MKGLYLIVKNSMSAPPKEAPLAPSLKPKPQPQPTGPKKRSEPSNLSKPRVLYVGDSVANNVEINKIENKTESRIRRRKAYSSIYDKRAKWPKQNVKDV